MKIYHLPVPTDQAGDAYVAEHQPVITGAGGQIALSRSFGNGQAIVVIILPDNVAPGDAGVPDAQYIADLQQGSNL